MTVFANGLEVSCKAQANKVIAAFPYVCMTPPQTPATPPGVPVPYPTFGMDGDTDKGTSTVKIGGETVTQKNVSYYTKCTGNEAGCAPMKNVISHVNTGKEYAHAWSGNVKMDGEPVSRFSDISSNDHASPTAGGTPMPKVGMLDLPPPTNSEVLKACEGAYEAMTNTELPERYSRIHQDSVTRGEATRAEAYGRVVEATTLGTGSILGGSVGGSASMRAHSRTNIGKKYGKFAQGTRDPKTSNARSCGSGKPFKYPDNSLKHRHAEAKMIEDWAAAGMPGTLILSVSRPVCPDCAALIRHVNCSDNGGQNCNKIIVCPSNQNQESMGSLSCD